MFQKFLPFFLTAMLFTVLANAQFEPCLEANIDLINANCNAADGIVTITPTNGTPPYFHSGIGGPGGQFDPSITFTNLAPGVYTVYINDSDTCGMDFTFLIDSDDPMSLSVIGTNVSCAGGTDGSASVSITGGVAPYTISWNNGATTQDIFGLSAGTYLVLVTDANNCVAEAAITLVDPSQMVLGLVISDELCPNDGTGSIEVFVTGGSGAYTYSWSNGTSNTPINNNLFAGTYCVTVTDSNGCVAEMCATVLSPPPFQVNIDIQQPTSSNSDGTITLAVTGGTPPYLYQWSNGSNGNQNTNLPAGTYSVTIIDANGCVVTENGIVLDNANLEVVVTDVICGGESTGSIEINPLYGAPPYAYSWTSTGGFTSTDQNIYDIPAGIYTVEIIDVDNIILTQTILVSENPSLIVNLSFTGFCSGDPITGTATVTGGVPPYTYDWGGLDPNNLPPGSLTVVVTDANGCQGFGTGIAVEPIPMTVGTAVTNPTCGQPNGCIEAIVTGGTPPYTYIWSDGNTAQTICGLSEGDYLLTVTDANGCALALGVTLSGIGGPEITIMGSQVVCNDEGFINVQVTGVSPFTYAWADDPAATGPNRTDLTSGTYEVTVTDDQACTVVGIFVISSSILLEMESTEADCDSTGGTATAIVTGGATNPTYLWSTGGTAETITDLAPGGYSVTVTDPGPGCRRHENVIVELDTACYATISGTVYLEEVNTDCLPDNNAGTIPGILVQLDNGLSTFTDNQGNYTFQVEPGLYAVELVPNIPQYAVLCGGPISVDVSSTLDVSVGNDFFMEYGVDKDLKIYVNKGNARPGFTQSIQICVWNFGANDADGTLTFVHDAIQEYISSSPTETSYDLATQTITWDFFDLAPGGVKVYWVNLKLEPSVPLGTNLNLNFEVTPIAGDQTPWNNTIHCPMVVTGSYDPNDKAVSPGFGENGIIYAMDTLLTYRIRFQNTGTDTAFTVVIKDTLEADLDIETVIPGPSSHEYTLSIESPRTLVFTFDNIMLPDSFVNEPASNGFVFFDIRPIEGTTFGTVIENSAAIFFDFNPPIITNTTVTTFDEFVGTSRPQVEDLPLTIQPNPTTGAAVLSYSLDEAQEVWVKVYDVQGRLLMTLEQGQDRKAGNHQVSIPAEQLSGGLYWIQVQTNKRLQGTTKLIRMNGR